MITQMNKTAKRSELFATSIHAGKRLALSALLCATALTGTLLAQEARPPEQSPPQSKQQAGEQPISDKETLPPANGLLQVVEPSPQASQSVDGDIIFTSPGQFTYPRDIRLSDNFGGLRFFGADSLTTSPAGAAIQFFGNNASPFNGQLYLDSGALNSAALIFRTAPTGGTITERMRVTSQGNIGIGTDAPAARLHVENRFGGSNDPAVAGYGSSGYGVFGESNSSFGVFGNSTSGFGLYGQSLNSVGVNGYSDTSHGMYGQNSTGAPGSGGSIAGVFGTSASNFGVLGVSSNGTGVEGRAIGSGNAVQGNATQTTGFAGLFLGRVQVTGNLTKGGGSFKIDHPLDPANKYLSHSFVESPDMLNIYNGNVVLDRRGRATVTLPAYFAALNREFRYQLTAVGAPGPNLHVAAEIEGNTFKVAGGRPGMKVSWQVTGIRQDAYAEKHRIQVEEEKMGEERGTYLHPEAFGQPKEKGVTHARHSASRPQPKEETSKETTAAKRVITGQQ